MTVSADREGATRVRCTPVDISVACAPTPSTDDATFEAEYVPTLLRLPAGEQIFRGVPFSLAPADAAKRFIPVTGARTVRVTGKATHVIFAHACAPLPGQVGIAELDLWERAAEEIGRYVLVFADGGEQSFSIRRRIEVNEWVPTLTPPGLTAVVHADHIPVDFRGPHERQSMPSWGLPGSSSMQGLPGSYSWNQGGIGFSKGTGDSNYWLYAGVVDDPTRELAAIRIEATSPTAASDGLMVGGITLFEGTSSPLAHGPGRTWLVTGDGIDMDLRADVDFGVARFPRRRIAPIIEDAWFAEPVKGLGDPAGTLPGDGVLIDVSGSVDATLTIAGRAFALADVKERKVLSVEGVEVRELAPLRTVRVTVTDTNTQELTPTRVSVHDAFGRYLPAAGHRDEVNLGLMEHYGADLQLGNIQYSYVPGEFEIDLPLGTTYWEIVRGPETRVVRQRVDITEDTTDLAFEVTRWIDMRADGWLSTDTHAHLVPSPTAIFEARAEGLNFVHILATQLGHYHQNTGDLSYGTIVDQEHETAVYIGSEQRQPLLGHMSLLNPGRPIHPFGHGGAPTSPFGGGLRITMADWADRCRAQGGLVISPHFPFPYGEIIADVILGKIDAIEIFGLTPQPEGPRIRCYYRLLNCGYHVPIAGGTDKMSAGTMFGALRTYAQLAPGEEYNWENWVAAVRAGRTFQTSGPMLSLTVDGQPMGGAVQLPEGGGTVHVKASARVPFDAGRLEIVVNGKVAAAADANGANTVEIGVPVEITQSSWISARSATPYSMRIAFPTAIGGHTSPVTVACGAREQLDLDDARTLLGMITGTRDWVTTLAVFELTADQDHILKLLDSAHSVLAGRVSAAT